MLEGTKVRLTPFAMIAPGDFIQTLAALDVKLALQAPLAPKIAPTVIHARLGSTTSGLLAPLAMTAGPWFRRTGLHVTAVPQAKLWSPLVQTTVKIARLAAIRSGAAVILVKHVL